MLYMIISSVIYIIYIYIYNYEFFIFIYYFINLLDFDFELSMLCICNFPLVKRPAAKVLLSNKRLIGAKYSF